MYIKQGDWIQTRDGDKYQVVAYLRASKVMIVRNPKTDKEDVISNKRINRCIPPKQIQVKVATPRSFVYHFNNNNHTLVNNNIQNVPQLWRFSQTTGEAVGTVAGNV